MQNVIYYYLATPGKRAIKSLCKVPVSYICEDACHGLVIKLINGDDL